MSSVEDIKEFTLAIIGGGPRGLSAMESLFLELSLKTSRPNLSLLLLEATDQLGNGPIYHLEQPDTNWLNISERGLTLPGRKKITFATGTIPAFPGFQEWIGKDFDTISDRAIDQFPLRSQLGAYLSKRFESISESLISLGILNIVSTKAIGLNYVSGLFKIETTTTKYYAKDVLLTIGHQPTEPDEQLSHWDTKAKRIKNLKLFKDSYPVENIRQQLKKNSVIAIRGFGLAMIDVCRVLTIGLGGKFTVADEQTREMVYTSKEEMYLSLIPFSLDGLSMAPKPLNQRIDSQFTPTTEELKLFSDRLELEISKGRALANGLFVVDAIAPLAAAKFIALRKMDIEHQYSLDELTLLVTKWLTDEKFEHPLISPSNIEVDQSMLAFCHMATGKREASLDYCASQIWRHCQPTMYDKLSFANFSEKVITELVQRDERLKRYTYGPPVDSIQQLLALNRAGILDFTYVEDPEISLTENGWQLASKNNSIQATILINSVLDAPKIIEVRSSIVKELLEDSLIEPVHSSLGIETNRYGMVVSNKTPDIPLCVLGRLAKGTLIGVDAILECFGKRSRYWALGALDRNPEIMD